MALACAIPGSPYPRKLLPGIASGACTGSCASCAPRRCWHRLLQTHLLSGVPACSSGSRFRLDYPTSPELFAWLPHLSSSWDLRISRTCHMPSAY